MLGDRREARISPIFASRSTGPTFLDRLDPLYEVAWSDAVRTRWSTIGTTRHVLRIRNGFLVHADRHDPSPVEVSPARLYRPAAIQTVALLAQYHQLSTLQLASWLGTKPTRVWSALLSLHAAGVVRRAVPPWWDERDDREMGGTGSLWQLDPTEPDRVQRWLDGLTDLEYLLVTAGRDLTKGTAGATGTATRHNITLAEIALRAVECCPSVVGAWGEPQATAELLAPGTEELRANIADGVVVARDGSLVVIETSGHSNLDNGSAGPALQAKAKAWAAIAARSPAPMHVLFVNIAAAGRRRRFNWHVLQGIEASDEFLTRDSMRETARQRVLTVDAHDWFPLPQVIGDGFRTLEGFNPVTQRYQDVVPLDVELDPSSDVVVNTLAALHTPAWTVRDAVPLLAG